MQVDHHTTSFCSNHTHGVMDFVITGMSFRGEHIPEKVMRVHANQDRLDIGYMTHHQSKVDFVIQVRTVGNRPEFPEFCFEFARTSTLNT